MKYIQKKIVPRFKKRVHTERCAANATENTKAARRAIARMLLYWITIYVYALRLASAEANM